MDVDAIFYNSIDVKPSLSSHHDVVSLLMKRELVFLDIDADTFEFTAILLLSNWAMYCTGSRLADGCACRIDSPKV